MRALANTVTPFAALEGSMRDFRVPPGSNLLDRVNGFYQWQDLRRQHGLWPYSRSTEEGPTAVCAARDDCGQRSYGINFSSQDYLSLSSHPEVKAAAVDAIERYGVHSAGSPALVGNTTESVALERKIAEFLQVEEVVLFPTGWAAGFGVIRALVRSADHIVMDNLAHACLQEGAAAATRNVSLFRHLQIDECREKLRVIRENDKENGIMVVTESLFSMDSDTPDLVAMQELCREYNATLMVDVAHDLGCLGEDGHGHIGLQNMIGKIDLVMGSFSKTFASNGGFVAANSRAVKEYLRFYSSPYTFSNAMSPVQAAIVRKAFDIVDSPMGRTLRAGLMSNILDLRAELRSANLEIYGDPSAIVCVKVGNEGLARLVSRCLPEVGLLANLVEFPAVPKGQARFRMQVMTNHTPKNVTDAVQRLRVAFDQANTEAEANSAPQLKATA